MSESNDSGGDQTPETSAKKGNMLFRAKKNMGGKVAASGLGKKALPLEAKALLKALRKIVEVVEGDNSKKAEEIERNILKLLVKAKIHADNKAITLKDFLKADQPLRQSFEILNDCFDYYEEDKNERIQKLLLEKFFKVERLLREVEKITSNMLKPHLQPKSLNRLKVVFDYLASTTFLTKVWNTPNIYDDLFQLVNAMNRYTQFHYDE